MIRQIRNPYLIKTFPYMIVHQGKYGNSYWLIREESDVFNALMEYIENFSDFYTVEDEQELVQLKLEYGEELGTALFVESRSFYEYEKVFVECFDNV